MILMNELLSYITKLWALNTDQAYNPAESLETVGMSWSNVSSCEMSNINGNGTMPKQFDTSTNL